MFFAEDDYNPSYQVTSASHAYTK